MKTTNRLKRVFVIMLVSSVILVSGCSKNASTGGEDQDDDNDTGGTITYASIRFRVTCGIPASGRRVEVRLFNQDTGQKLLWGGGTLASGTFCSPPMDISKNYRIELFERGSGDCVMWLKDITYQDDPILWVEDCSLSTNATIHLGGDCDNVRTVSDCWEN